VSPLETIAYIGGTAASLAAIMTPIVLWAGKRIRRANAADTETATRRAIDEAITPVAGDVRDLRDRMTRVEAQYSNNGGSSLRDRVDTSVRVTGEIKASFDQFQNRFEDHLQQASEDRAEYRGRLTDLEQAIRRH